MSQEERLKKVLERDGLGECRICGHQTYEGREKCHGFQETPNGELQLICSIYFQVQCTINKDSLHGSECNGSPFVRMYLVNPNEPRKVVSYKVLDCEPWLEKGEVFFAT
jgi:hypothetical protein